MVVLGQAFEFSIAGLGESLHISRRPHRPFLRKRLEVVRDQRVSKLLRQDRRDAHSNAIVNALFLEVVERVQQR